MKKNLKLGLKIAGLSVAWIPASAMALATIDVPTTLNSCAPLNKEFFRNSVKNKAAATKPVTQLAMLASHDALSDHITINSRMDPYSPNTTQLAQLARYLGPGALVRMSKAQQDNIYTQLNAGVRYIDARITHLNGNYYTHHTMMSDTLSSYLIQILKWLDENPGEFVFFHIYYFNYCKDTNNPSYETPAAAWTNLESYIKTVTYKGKSLFDYDYTLKNKPDNCLFGDITYNDITENGTKAGAVLFFSSDKLDEAPTDAWCYKHIYSTSAEGNKYLINPCALSMKATKVKENLEKGIKSAQAKGANKVKYLRYAQTQTTPNVDDIPETLTGWSLIQKAHDHNSYILNRAGINWDEVFNDMPIYMCDYSTDNSTKFCQTVIDKMAKFNSKIA